MSASTDRSDKDGRRATPWQRQKGEVDFFIAAMLMIATACFSALMASIIINDGWVSDCSKIGAHVYREKAYECEPRK